MKTFITSILLSASALSFCSFFQNDCGAYITARKGAMLEYKHYDEKNKVTGSNKSTVNDIRTTASGQEYEIKAETFDKNEKSTGTSTFVLTCENNNFYVDMRSLVTPEQMESFKDMQLTAEGDKLDIPANPSAGQTLKNGSFKMTGQAENSPLKMKLTINITNRKVEAIEDVTIPLGSFPCVKITYDVDTKLLFSIKSKVTEWYSKGVGLIKSETYNAKGKLVGSTVLQSRGMAK